MNHREDMEGNIQDMEKKLTKVGAIILLIFLLGLGGCGTEDAPSEGITTEHRIAEKATEMTTEETVREEEDTQPEQTEEGGMEVQFISGRYTDYDKLRETGHAILAENICQSPISVYDDPWLLEQLAEWTNIWGIDDSDTVDYFTFDLNDDGVDEYIISLDGSGLSGSDGNIIDIWRKDENGNLESFFAVVSRLHVRDHEYASLTVLEETSGGYHSIVFPESYNRVWFYDEESGSYDSVDDIDYDRGRACLDEWIPELNVWEEYVEQQSGGETQFTVDISFIFFHIYRDDMYMGSYYPVYVKQKREGELVTTLTVFYLSMEYDEVLWGGPREVQGRIYTLEEWRASSEYPDLGGLYQ